MQKIRKIPLSHFLEICITNQSAIQPTNQTIITNNTGLIGSRWRRSKNKKIKSIRISKNIKNIIFNSCCYT